MANGTVFEFVILGPVGSSTLYDGENLMVGLSLVDAVQRFWEVEEPPSLPQIGKPEECELFY